MSSPLHGRSEAPLAEVDDDDIEARDAAAERASLRDALALEDAGELRAAARLFEYVGEHDQAAALRLEYAASTTDPTARLSILREGAARNRGNTPQGRALHLTLARALLQRAAILDDGATRRTIVLEAARSLELCQRGAEAGRIYEELGLLARAERAYREAGDIERYEAVLERLESRERARDAARALRSQVAGAIQEGRRGVALELLRWPSRDSATAERTIDPELVRILDDLERRLPRGGRVRVRWRTGAAEGETLVVSRPTLSIGRGPENDIVVATASVSRRHVTLGLGSHEGQPTVTVTDMGSRSGTFVDGDALEPGAPTRLNGSTDLAIGMGYELGVACPSPGTALIAWGEAWVLFAPEPTTLTLDPEHTAPARLESRHPYVALAADEGTPVELNGRPVGSGATIELLVGDVVVLGELNLEVVG